MKQGNNDSITNNIKSIMKTVQGNADIKLKDFKIIRKLGNGVSGTVYQVELINSNKHFVIKQLEMKIKKEKLEEEVDILKKIDHNHLIKFYNSFFEDDLLNIVMEYAELGDLYSYMKIRKNKNKLIPEDEIWYFAYQILLGVDYLHSNNIIHRDIKLLNIFLNKENIIKIGDLGMSKLLPNKENLMKSTVGTPLYIAPEIIKNVPYDYKIDIWAVGCSLYHLAALIPPFNEDNLIILGDKIVNSEPENLPIFYSSDLNKFIRLLICKNPKYRPMAKDALKLIPKYIKKKYDEILEINKSPQLSKLLSIQKSKLPLKNIGKVDFDLSTFGGNNTEKPNINDKPNSSFGFPIKNTLDKKTVKFKLKPIKINLSRLEFFNKVRPATAMFDNKQNNTDLSPNDPNCDRNEGRKTPNNYNKNIFNQFMVGNDYKNNIFNFNTGHPLNKGISHQNKLIYVNDSLITNKIKIPGINSFTEKENNKKLNDEMKEINNLKVAKTPVITKEKNIEFSPMGANIFNIKRPNTNHNSTRAKVQSNDFGSFHKQKSNISILEEIMNGKFSKNHASLNPEDFKQI